MMATMTTMMKAREMMALNDNANSHKNWQKNKFANNSVTEAQKNF